MRTFLAVLTLLTLLVFGLLTCGCMGPSPDSTVGAGTAVPTSEVQDYSYIETITYSNENSTTVIQKNKLTKNATIDMTMHLSTRKIEGLNKSAYYEFGTTLTAGLMQLTFFDDTSHDAYNELIEEWNAENCTIHDDSPQEQVVNMIGENPLAGYTVQSVSIHILGQGTEEPISDIMITGPEKEDVSLTYF